ncbi:hypothetical protein [Nocardia sp. N2S4-5]|uniref:hypothetical protein n=1 Tax=Nocardia sp. N2S4-5 TaxID=3351565 RepID=UPI0037D63CD4
MIGIRCISQQLLTKMRGITMASRTGMGVYEPIEFASGVRVHASRYERYHVRQDVTYVEVQRVAVSDQVCTVPPVLLSHNTVHAGIGD